MGALFWILAGIGFGAALALGVYWLFWLLWCWVLPELWASGPANIVAPNFWLFVGACLLISFIGRMIFGGRSNDSK